MKPRTFYISRILLQIEGSLGSLHKRDLYVQRLHFTSATQHEAPRFRDTAPQLQCTSMSFSQRPLLTHAKHYLYSQHGLNTSFSYQARNEHKIFLTHFGESKIRDFSDTLTWGCVFRMFLEVCIINH